MTAPDATDRHIIIDTAGPAALVFDKRGGYGVEVNGQRVRVGHLRSIVAAYDAAVGGDGDG